MHGYAFAPKSIYPGQATFQRFYTEIFPNFKITPGTFQDIGGYHLGNVYTQVYSFHKDFGVTGVITLQLLRRKYSEQDIIKIWGGNWLRVMTQVQNFKH